MDTTTVNRAMSFDPPPLLIDRFRLEHNVSDEEARLSFEETKKFLLLCADDRSGKYAPSPRVDLMWHRFILHSRDYFQFCELIGGYVHHQPSVRYQGEHYTNTLKALRGMFGDVDSVYWNEKIADCANCEGCTGACTS